MLELFNMADMALDCQVDTRRGTIRCPIGAYGSIPLAESTWLIVATLEYLRLEILNSA
jgi:hypothetical protein